MVYVFNTIISEDKSRTVVMDKDKGEPVISVKTEDKKDKDDKKPEGEKVEEKDKKPEGEKVEGEATTTTEEGAKTDGE